MNMLSLLKPAPHIKRLPTNMVDATYKRYRYQNFVAIFIAYASYYLLRNNFSLAIPHLIREGLFSKTQLGIVLSSLSFSYGISKFVMGNISDRSNPRYFITIGLLFSILINIIFGFSPGITSSLVAMFILIFIIGWAQGMGAPPCFRTLAHWFSVSERGRVTSVWTVSPHLGSAVLCLIAGKVTSVLDWRSIFYFPAIIAMVTTIVVLMLMRDTPQSVGLMPIEEYKSEFSEIVQHGEKELSGNEILFKYVLQNKHVWFLSFAAIFVYFVRHGVLIWAPAYLTEIQHIDIASSYFGPAIYEIAGIIGALLSGYINDKFFKRKSAIVSILFLIAVFVGILLYWRSSYILLKHVALFLIGISIYGPLTLISVQILDISSKKAVGTTEGMVGLLAYLGGVTSASAGFGYLVDNFGWDGGFIALLTSCILAIFFFGMTLKTNDALV